MKVYLIHEMSGDCEDYRDVIVGAYTNEEKAKIRKDKFIEENTKKDKCKFCPINGYCSNNCNKNCEECDLEKIINKYCDRASLYHEYDEEYDEDSILCKNEICSYREDCSYEIEELEVIE